jgi:PAS domain S-box-containing protein
MSDQDKTKQQLLEEVVELRQRVAALEGVEIEGKRAEEELRRSRTILSEAEKLSHIGAWEWDLVGNRWTFSDEWLSIHGSHRRTLTLEELLPITHPDDREAIEQAYDDVRNHIKPYEMEHRIIRQDTREVRIVKARGQYVLDSAGKVARVYGFAVDITEQQRAEETRREKEARLLEAQEVARLGFYVLDVPQGRWISSPILDHIFGIPPDYERTVNGWAELVHPDERQEMLDYFSREVIGEGKPFDREYRIIRHRDKQVRWVHGLGRLQFNEEGHPIFMLATIQDITDRKQAEEALQKAHDKLDSRVRERTAELTKANEELDIFRKFAESSGEGFGMSDFDGRIVYANPSLCRLFGEEKPNNVIGKNVSTYYLPEYVQRRKDEMIPTLLREGYWYAEQTVLPHHGKPIQTLQSTFLIRDESGNPFRIAVVISDITERKRAEEALRQSHDELRAIYDGMIEGLLITDIETKRISRVNSSFCRMLGYGEEELLTKSIPDLHPPEEVPNDLQRFQAAAEGRVSINEDRPVLRKDGSIFYADITGHRILYEGRPCLLGLFRDVTERRQAQAARERERRTLEHMLKASDRERRLIAYDIHDGLAQELAGAIMQFETFDHLKEAKPKQAIDAYHAGMTILRQGHFEARRLISGVRPLILDEAGVLAAIAHLVHEPAFANGPTIDFRSRVTFSRLAPVLEDIVYRIVQEGLTNARNHSKSQKILVSLLQRGDRLRIKIQDWGVGFDPKTVQENRFGLEGIRERARVLRGKCSIKSKPGEGTVVVVELPVVEQEVE